MENRRLGPLQKTVVGVQFLFVAFGATVLVSLLVGMDPSVALFTAGIGTLIFHMVTKGKVPSSWVAVLRSLPLSSRLLSWYALGTHRRGCGVWHHECFSEVPRRGVHLASLPSSRCGACDYAHRSVVG